MFNVLSKYIYRYSQSNAYFVISFGNLILNKHICEYKFILYLLNLDIFYFQMILFFRVLKKALMEPYFNNLRH